jgi:hypothetical protein
MTEITGRLEPADSGGGRMQLSPLGMECLMRPGVGAWPPLSCPLVTLVPSPATLPPTPPPTGLCPVHGAQGRRVQGPLLGRVPGRGGGARGAAQRAAPAQPLDQGAHAGKGRGKGEGRRGAGRRVVGRQEGTGGFPSHTTPSATTNSEHTGVRKVGGGGFVLIPAVTTGLLAHCACMSRQHATCACVPN